MVAIEAYQCDSTITEKGFLVTSCSTEEVSAFIFVAPSGHCDTPDTLFNLLRHRIGIAASRTH